jgi:hypothetical protein
MRNTAILVMYEIAAATVAAVGIQRLFHAARSKTVASGVEQRLVWLLKALLFAVLVVVGTVFAVFYVPAAIALNGGLW